MLKTCLILFDYNLKILTFLIIVWITKYFKYYVKYNKYLFSEMKFLY